MRCRGEYTYTQRISQNDWGYMDGNRREARNPTLEEVSSIDGETQKLGFGEFAEYTYMGGLKYKLKYSEFLTEEGDRGHIDRGGFPKTFGFPRSALYTNGPLTDSQ